MNDQRFIELLESFAGQRVLVIGDFILDEYTIGDTKRVSREAPVIVVDYRESRYHPGGAANAVQNVASLGGGAFACGVVGEDSQGEILTQILKQKGADVDLLLPVSGLRTSVKTRILAGELHAQKQQIARIDRTSVVGDHDELERLADGCRDAVSRAGAVIMSDYGLGVTTDPVRRSVLDACRRMSVPVVVDSRFRLMQFTGATTAVPNEVELVDSVDGRGREANEVAVDVARKLGLAGLIVTRGSQGMRVVVPGGETTDIGIVGSRDVTDVTGAGDTVAAAVALALAGGASLVEAAEMATYAAAIVVMKRGTATVDRDEIRVLRAKYPAPEQN